MSIRLAGLALICLATLGLATADTGTLAALGCSLLIGILGSGFALAIGASLITTEDREEADGK